ncbi:MAG: response regulator, partial [Collinsella sp.]|nr:response regulator [Collinsella sp.]
MPDANGIFLIEKIKKESGVPIIILSDNGEEYNKVAALDVGADDYITKP